MKVNDSKLVKAGHSGTSDPSGRRGLAGPGSLLSRPHTVPFDGCLAPPFGSQRAPTQGSFSSVSSCVAAVVIHPQLLRQQL